MPGATFTAYSPVHISLAKSVLMPSINTCEAVQHRGIVHAAGMPIESQQHALSTQHRQLLPQLCPLCDHQQLHPLLLLQQPVQLLVVHRHLHLLPHPALPAQQWQPLLPCACAWCQQPCPCPCSSPCPGPPSHLHSSGQVTESEYVR